MRAVSAKTLLLAALAVNTLDAHQRWVCPAPRSEDTGAKQGPCDAADPGPELHPPMVFAPGLQTVVFEESLFHPSAPSRVALSFDGEDDGFEECILLDHIPHNNDGKPIFFASSTYVPFRFSIEIPDVSCERCHLQLVGVMSDAIHGVPKGTRCTYKGALQSNGGPLPDDKASRPGCPVVYHSCAAVKITGSVPRKDFKCNSTALGKSLKWPYLHKQQSIYDNEDDAAGWTKDWWMLPKGEPYSTPSGSCGNAWGSKRPQPEGTKLMGEIMGTTNKANKSPSKPKTKTTLTTASAARVETSGAPAAWLWSLHLIGTLFLLQLRS